MIAGGLFTTADGQRANFIASWDGSAWQPLGTGMDANGVWALSIYDDELIASGDFTAAGGERANRIARWHDCLLPCPSDIAPPGGDGVTGIDDLLAVISAWGPCPTPPVPCPANIVASGASATQVDIDDLLAVISGWGPCP